MAPATLTLDVPGLEHPAEIRIDRWGVPHIRALSRRDAFLVQGFNAARDRLWQIDLWRKRGLGLLAGDFGPGYLAQDRAARLFLYRGDEAAEWAAYGTSETRAVAEAFVGGINAFVGLTEADPAWLPPEFTRMGTRPARWQALDVARIRSHALTRNAPSEVARARLAAQGGLALDRFRKILAPDHRPAVPEGLDPAQVPPEVIDAVRLATAGVGFRPDRLLAGRDEAETWTFVDEFGAVGPARRPPEDGPPDGSNNWAVAPSRTATGRPILASDPHRAITLPSLRYVVHLSAPGLDVIGAGEPALPGISIGHNGRAAFSLTIAPIDQEDLLVYETHQDDPDLYRYGEGWERMRIVTETAPVRGGPEAQHRLAFTRHGPVVHEDRVGRRAFALRTVWTEPGTAAYLGSLAYLDADSPEAFGAALRHWSAPSVNHLYADVSGRIGWFVAGKAPRRPNWDGLMPVPGDGRYEWDGFVAPEDLPRRIDPPEGFVASANEMNLPEGYPHRLGHEWHEPWRARRIRAVLAGQPRHGLADSAALQGDDHSHPALALAGLAREALGGEAGPLLREPLALLAGFDGRLREESAAAALLEIWWVHHLRPALLAALAPDRATAELLAPGDTEALLGLLGAPAPPLDRAARDRILGRTLAEAFRDAAARLGADPAGWAWGRLHHAHLVHPLAPLGFSGHDVPRLPLGGSGVTVMYAGYRPDTFRVTHGASFRMVLDVGEWDASLFVNGPGQSGDPRSSHYADHAETWAGRGHLPLLYSRAAVDGATRQLIRLVPGRA